MNNQTLDKKDLLQEILQETLVKRTIPRQIKITPNINPYALGSVIVEYGNTKIHITASLEKEVPAFLKGSAKGWVTAEYAMLPHSTHTRTQRERKGICGRSQEIQRLIGRSLRAAIDLNLLGERSIMIDCDVLVADGGTRTASISGGFVALGLAVKKLLIDGVIKSNPIKERIAGVSVGITKDGSVIADLNYDEDSSVATDMNIVMSENGRFIELQGTAEGTPFSKNELDRMLYCAQEACKTIFEEQKKII
ncbi:MAG: ribonuclease PH [Oligoflexia bacterium]|nr:ribonuclease PH [Oligoflexia bacterium]